MSAVANSISQMKLSELPVTFSSLHLKQRLSSALFFGSGRRRPGGDQTAMASAGLEHFHLLQTGDNHRGATFSQLGGIWRGSPGFSISLSPWTGLTSTT